MAPLTRAATARAASPSTPRVLVVFDFDESLVDHDSDVFFLQSLDPELLQTMLASLAPHPDGHSALEDHALERFHERKPTVSRQEMRDAIARIPVSSKMIDAVKFAVDKHDAMVVIASDANDFFIRSMLEHNGITDYVTEIHANKAKWEKAKSTRLRVKPYHAKSKKPHGCALCPKNLCKGQILDNLRKKHVFDQVLYVGDGGGDFCPCARLTSRDTVFARADSAKGRSYGLLKKINEASPKLEARVVEWHSPDDMLELFEKALVVAPVA